MNGREWPPAALFQFTVASFEMPKVEGKRNDDEGERDILLTLINGLLSLSYELHVHLAQSLCVCICVGDSKELK